MEGTGFSPYMIVIYIGGLQPLRECAVGESHELIENCILNHVSFDRVCANVLQMAMPVFFIADAVIVESRLPYFEFPIEFSLGAK